MRRSTLIPYKPVLTEKNLPDQSSKVFIVTGGSGGIGKELITILYAHNAKVYVAARSRDKTVKIIDEIKRTTTSPKGGDLIFLPLQLDNLTTIKSSASIFLAREPRLDILFLNAGAMIPPHGSTTAQGHGLQLGINNLGHFLFAQLLTPLMTHTVTSGTAPRNSVRMIWVSSSAADSAPKPAVDFANIDYAHEEGLWTKYMRSKAGNAIHAVEFARRLDGTGVLSMALNPGNFITGLQQNTPSMQLAMFKLLTSHPRNGAYTELFAAFDPSITEQNNGGWVEPFGRLVSTRKDLTDPELGRRYREWSEMQVRAYM